MKRTRIPVLCLTAVLALGLTACGTKEPEPIPEAVPAPEITAPAEMAASPFDHYLDLSGLTPDTLAKARQTIGQSVTRGNVTVTLTESMGDGYTLYLNLTITTADGHAFDLLSGPQQLDFSLSAADSTPIPLMNQSTEGTQVDDNTLSYLIRCTTEDCITGQQVNLVLSNVEGADAPFQFTWTAENTGAVKTCDILNGVGGAPCGTARITSFSLLLQIDAVERDSLDSLAPTVQLLDGQGAAILSYPSVSVTDTSLNGYLLIPVEVSQVAALEMPPYTGQFS